MPTGYIPLNVSAVTRPSSGQQGIVYNYYVLWTIKERNMIKQEKHEKLDENQQLNKQSPSSVQNIITTLLTHWFNDLHIE